jgi:preprotein translocase subunit SecF
MFSMVVMKDEKKNLHNFVIMLSRNVSIAFAIVSVVAVVVIFSVGFKKGIDFAGGTLIDFKYTQAVDIEQARENLANVLGTGHFVMQQSGDDVYTFKVGTVDIEDMSVEKCRNAIEKVFPSVVFNQIESVGPQVSGGLIKQSIIAIIFSFVAILVYMLVRFNWHFAVAGVVMLLQDVLITAFFVVITRLEMNLTMVAAFLTIIGYCINDTVVLYDRIRSNFINHSKETVRNVVASSVVEVLRRSIITSFVTILSLCGVLFFSDFAIRNFAITVIFGIVIGTIGSVFVSSFLPLRLGLSRVVHSPTKERKKDPMFYAS